ncbi:pre-RNA processing PIH1/Nop17-domain-containing protein [Mycena albidolilacea]|uniref:Pre-RNA processing PIH1/Nop17-domain-containing protein n=1 Tax=Mycena albidolilacea TaxID=1033008 RepID=A0AAD7EWB9_9AGAR|nr:pre-RNA processing PIH1/Nop17-domain-containing protein [Mycena albidolilacea]
MSKVQVALKPTAGFCIKSATLQPAVLKLASSVPPVPSQRKIFINIAWDSQVPPPPEGNEEAIQRAMHSEDEHLNPDAWFVPVVVSEARQDTDKSGNPSLVFDCIYHTSIKSRTVRDAAFKVFIQELALQRIEAQTSLVLSRQISTPNIASKGKLLPRTVLVPSAIPTAPHKRPLIEEISSPSPAVAVSGHTKSDAPTKGILKPPTASAPSNTTTSRLTWRWSKTTMGAIEITIVIPYLTRALVTETTLELEARRLLLTVRGHPPLDINVGVSDAEIAATCGTAPDGGLTLKRERELDVEAATAEWRVADGVLVVLA